MKKYISFLFSFLFLFSVVNSVFAAPSSGGEETCISPRLDYNLKFKDRDINKEGQVSVLQKFLVEEGYLNVAPTGYFGKVTLKALADFQKSNNITPAVGYMGPITRNKIKQVRYNSCQIYYKASTGGVEAWSTLAENYTGFGSQVIYPSNWIVTYINGGSYGTANSVVGVGLEPSVSVSDKDSISIGGFQYDCSNVNVSGGNNPATKAYCIQSDGSVWSGVYITSQNEGNVYGAPMVTNSTNPKFLEMFDLIVQRNTY